MLPTLSRSLSATSRRLATSHNPYQPKKIWPPDFSKLSPREQLKFEKKYKRRVALASARPRWDKAIKLTQLFAVTFVITYSVFFMDWKGEHQPFEGVRRRLRGIISPDTPSPRASQQQDTPNNSSTR
ncbi:hypothetical protein NKR23_g3962 [Pleurostoma richardsiae]|uniref:Uncharacterized protein n=1 Tax=Pleurostoma richardsiae TaxID=41990 RepID=A0AA38RHQ3_9PEZI|nr:hypothetical protein NKR23_g3962 [Pleurostoma richardsiae]